MRTKTFKKIITAVTAVCILSLSSCVSDVYDPKDPDPDPAPGTNPDNGPIFDFSTEKSYTLTVRYDVPEGYLVEFAVYTEKPTTLDKEDQVVMKDIKAIAKGYTDKLGVYSYPIKIPATVKKLYIHSTFPGVPELMTAEVNGDVLSDAVEVDYEQIMSKAKSYVLRAGEDYKKEPYNQLKFPFPIQRLGYWQNVDGINYKGQTYRALGRPDYLLPTVLPISAEVLSVMSQQLKDGKNVDYNKLGNGDINVVKKAHVDLYLLSEFTSAHSTLAYYCYETNNPPKSVNDLKHQTIAFPNAKQLGREGGMGPGEGIRLNYYKDGVNKGTEFPEGTSIGWVLYNNGYRPAYQNSGAVNKGGGAVYSDPIMDGKNYVALFRLDNFVIYGFEDWINESDCNDVVFHLASDPIDAITPDVPPVEPEKPTDDTDKYEEKYAGTLTFEDLWPNQGDFDMNDVVIKYNSTVNYNINNEVTKTTDTYTLLWSGATIRNSFAYQLNANKNDVSVEFSSSTGHEGQAYLDPNMSIATIRLFNDALALTNSKTTTSEITVTTTYNRKYSKEDFIAPPYNPFITTSSNDKEVHLTKYKPTTAANASLLGTGDDRSNPANGNYYVTFVGIQQMPFAIHMPGEIDFVIPKESKRIDEYYPKFINWINTKGAQDADWYMHPNDEKPGETPVKP